MPSRRRERYTTFLVAPSDARSSGKLVYAVRVSGAAEALATVAAQVEGAGKPVIVGSLSTRTAKAMKLKPGELRPV